MLNMVITKIRKDDLIKVINFLGRYQVILQLSKRIYMAIVIIT